jgi:NAD(P)-dependent dehydrogenase (short-subunit alcohol dehydrogenase family)
MINPLDLTGRTILVTGASSGIGRATAVLLSRLGAKVVLNGRNEERLRDTLAGMEGDGHLIEPRDLNETETLTAWLQAVASRSGPLDGLVHSAGLHITVPIRFHDTKKAESLLRVNVLAAMGLVKGLCRKGVCAGGASTVLIASIMGLVGQSGVSAYAASKGALIALARSLAVELAGEGIRVNCVAPGHVRTEMAEKVRQLLTSEQMTAIEKMHPLGLGEPLDVANAIAFLLSPASRWITGTTLVVDGGYTAH